jgi:phospholipid transport system substrate-binding protein
MIALLALWLIAPLQAASYYPGYGESASPMPLEQAAPDQVLREGVGKLLKFMRQSQRPSQAEIARFLENEIAPYFDFAYMSTWVAGPMNRYMTDQQHAELALSVQQLLLGTLAQRLTSFQNQDVRFFPPRRVGENEVKVRVGILRAGGYPAKIDFRFYRGRDGWKVFDVAANGSSALSYYRQYFSRRMGGGQQTLRGY